MTRGPPTPGVEDAPVGRTSAERDSVFAFLFLFGVRFDKSDSTDLFKASPTALVGSVGGLMGEGAAGEGGAAVPGVLRGGIAPVESLVPLLFGLLKISGVNFFFVSGDPKPASFGFVGVGVDALGTGVDALGIVGVDERGIGVVERGTGDSGLITGSGGASPSWAARDGMCAAADFNTISLSGIRRVFPASKMPRRDAICSDEVEAGTFVQTSGGTWDG